ncbi:hypothetical protein SDC9_151630 [bioreactor metagenome]|uniref:Uncharacterized protein n=1 Tax=bioreactor metagenome TaxID=1076179 RepID=A0A645ESX7_9ZZZZ
MTTPVTFSPVFKVLIDFSNNSAKDSSISMISLLILSQTSFIIHPGVDAPAVIPTDAAPRKRDRSNCPASSTRSTAGQRERHNSASRRVLELLGSPMTTMASQLAANSCASDWRVDVALHIVSNISEFVHSFFTFSTQGSQTCLVDVVWQTMVTGVCRSRGF